MYAETVVAAAGSAAEPLHGAPLLPDVPDEPELPDEPDVPDEPEEPELPEEPDVPEEPEDPELPSAPRPFMPPSTDGSSPESSLAPHAMKTARAPIPTPTATPSILRAPAMSANS
jgi:hypothetical protein